MTYPGNEKNPNFQNQNFSINRAWRRLGEELGPYVAGKINDDSLKETRDVSTIMSKMVIPPAIWDWPLSNRTRPQRARIRKSTPRVPQRPLGAPEP